MCTGWDSLDVGVMHCLRHIQTAVAGLERIFNITGPCRRPLQQPSTLHDGIFMSCTVLELHLADVAAQTRAQY